MFRTIPNKNTFNGLSSDFGALTRWKKDVTDTPKTTKMVIGRWGPKQTLIGCATLENSGGLVIYKKDGHRNHLSPEMRSKRRRKQESTSSLKNGAMLALGNTILQHEHQDMKIRQEYPAQQDRSGEQ
jgi:hypothetical protein